MTWSSTRVAWAGLGVFALALGSLVSRLTSPLEAPAPIDAHRFDADAGRAPARPAGFVGVVVSSSTVDISPLQDGTLQSVSARVGDVVHRGQVLVTLESAELRHELAMAMAQLERDDADIERAVLERRQADERLERAEKASSHLNVDELSSARYSASFGATAEKALRARRAQNTAKVEQLSERLAQRTLRAPVESVVSERFLDPGAAVATGTVVLRLVGQGGWLVRFAIPEGEGASARRDAPVRVELPNVGRAWPGVVTDLAPSLDPASLTRLAEAKLTITEGGPAYGTAVRVWLGEAR